LSPIAKQLANFEMPLHIKVASIEALEMIKEPYETIYDLVFYEFVDVASPDRFYLSISSFACFLTSSERVLALEEAALMAFMKAVRIRLSSSS